MLSCAAPAPRRGSAGKGGARAQPPLATSRLAATQTRHIPSQTDPQAHRRPSQAIHPRQTGRLRISCLPPAARTSALCHACRLCAGRDDNAPPRLPTSAPPRASGHPRWAPRGVQSWLRSG